MTEDARIEIDDIIIFTDIFNRYSKEHLQYNEFRGPKIFDNRNFTFGRSTGLILRVTFIRSKYRGKLE